MFVRALGSDPVCNWLDDVAVDVGADCKATREKRVRNDSLFRAAAFHGHVSTKRVCVSNPVAVALESALADRGAAKCRTRFQLSFVSFDRWQFSHAKLHENPSPWLHNSWGLQKHVVDDDVATCTDHGWELAHFSPHIVAGSICCARMLEDEAAGSREPAKYSTA